MRTKTASFLLALLWTPAWLCALSQQTPVVVDVDAAHPGAAISPQMFGIFFEDINFGADGGLYPELVENRSFEFSEPLTGWHQELAYGNAGLKPSRGGMSVREAEPLNASNPHYLHVQVDEPGFGIRNAGFRGMGVRTGEEYRFSAYVRSHGPKTLHVVVKDSKGRELASGQLQDFTGEWQHYETVLRVSATEAHAQLFLDFEEKGDLDLDMVSLFPVDTWNHRPNGLRKDLVQLLYDMHPGFLRFPGGCIVEGRQLSNRYRWKTTVGDIAERKTILNRWNDEFDHRPSPEYFQSFGLGFYEYFQLAEDIGARPLPILNCGLACQYNTSETAAMDEMHEYVQDALDLIEFANGPVDSAWGKMRAQMGHPAPFHLQMIGVGNENWGERYFERYQLFANALKAKYPEIQLVVSAGPSPDGELFDSAWKEWRNAKADIVDEHYYQSPEWFLSNTHRYDRYDRSGPKVFAGEYAAQTTEMARPDNRNNWKGAIAEAAFMTGLERNGDVVRMASYAPLLASVDFWQWTPDAIWFDTLRSFGTPNYYVQAMYASNVGTRVVPTTPQAEKGIYTSTTLDERSHELIVKVINHNASAAPLEIHLKDEKLSAKAKVLTMQSADLSVENTFESPKKIAPVESVASVKDGVLRDVASAYSFRIYRIPLK